MEPTRMDAPRLTLVHDWLTGTRGGEKCLEPICRRFPDAALYTLIHAAGRVSPEIEALRPRTSFLQRLPRIHRFYRNLLPLMPAAIQSLRLPPSDLVLSFSHCVAKSVRPPAGVPHVCYCFTPMRYAWHLRESYFGGGRLGSLKRLAVDSLLKRIRNWDRATAERVTHFVAISRTVRERIRECYGRDSTIIHPPVDTDFYTPSAAPREDFYLCVSAFAPYKRLDLAIDACRKLRRRLIVIGTGQDEDRLRARASEGVFFLGWQSDESIREHYRRCRALLFPGEEDFGIVPVEAMACGAPVIAFGKGGAAETLRGLDADSPTGVFFTEQTSDCLIDAIDQFERSAVRFDPLSARRQALPFRRQRYEEDLLNYLAAIWNDPKKKPLAA
jgi:glycosyltransferase involved in cell wall biosynthesis